MDQKPLDPLTIEFYAPGVEGSCTIYDEDRPEIAVGYRRLEALGGGAGLIVMVSPTAGEVELVCRGVRLRSASVNGVKAGLTAAGTLRFDGRGSAVVQLDCAVFV